MSMSPLPQVIVNCISSKYALIKWKIFKKPFSPRSLIKNLYPPNDFVKPIKMLLMWPQLPGSLVMKWEVCLILTRLARATLPLYTHIQKWKIGWRWEEDAVETAPEEPAACRPRRVAPASRRPGREELEDLLVLLQATARAPATEQMEQTPKPYSTQPEIRKQKNFTTTRIVGLVLLTAFSWEILRPFSRLFSSVTGVSWCQCTRKDTREHPGCHSVPENHCFLRQENIRN